jgi:hypothetical protein
MKIEDGKIELPARGYTADQLAKGREGLCVFINRFHLFQLGNQSCFVTALAKLIDGHIFQLLQPNLVTEQIRLLVIICVVSFLVHWHFETSSILPW